MVTSGESNLPKRLRPCRTHQVDALAEAIVMAQTSPLGAPCVEIT